MSPSNWLFPTVILLLAALPLALFAVTAWNERERTLQVAERTAERTVVALHEHTLKVLETHELILGGVDHQIRGRSWSEIEQDEELWKTLIRVGRRFESVTAINLVDSAGRVRMTTAEYPTGAMVEDLGYDPIEATSGQEALAILNSHSNIDVVLTDQGMPGMTGLQLASAIRMKWPELPVVLVSGYAEVPDSVANTITVRLNKPFLQEDLSAVLYSAIEGGSPTPDWARARA